MSDQRDNRLVKLATLWERTSAKGRKYFSGFLEAGEVTRPNGEIVKTWKLLVQERDPDRRPQSRTRSAERGQRTWDRSRNTTGEPPQSWLDDSAEALRDLTEGPGR